MWQTTISTARGFISLFCPADSSSRGEQRKTRDDAGRTRGERGRFKPVFLLAFCSFWLVLAALALTGCGAGNGAPDEPAEPEEAPPFARLTDQMDREVRVPDEPERVVSLSPTKTEIAYALGLGDRLVGVTDYCNYPPEVEDIQKVGGFSDPNVEQIVALEPDLVLAASIHQEEVEKLEEMGVPVLVLYARNLEDIYQGMELVGTATGNEAEAREQVDSMQERIEAVKSRLEMLDIGEPVRVYYEVYNDPLMSAGGRTIINEVISLAGGKNIFVDVEEEYPVVSAESILDSEPQVILFPKYHGTAELIIEEMRERPGWDELPAVQDERVFGVHDDVFSRPGPRVVEAVEEAAKILYPALF